MVTLTLNVLKHSMLHILCEVTACNCMLLIQIQTLTKQLLVHKFNGGIEFNCLLIFMTNIVKVKEVI